jgi:protein-tyrosine-phosphatase
MGARPSSVLVACSHNAIRSPMAEALIKHLYGHEIYVDSVGLRAAAGVDVFAVSVLDEIGLDLSAHRPKSFDQLEDTSFDLIITLSPEAHHRALELTRTMACEVEYWQTMDPSVVEGAREARLAAYRDVRDALERRIRQRFGDVGGHG